MNGTTRKHIKIGAKVRITQKNNQKTGQLTEGIVQHILTNSTSHPHGIKVQLISGLVGRVKSIL
jgi:uncharacterized repeat protein (TIGR03833 family)